MIPHPSTPIIMNAQNTHHALLKDHEVDFLCFLPVSFQEIFQSQERLSLQVQCMFHIECTPELVNSAHIEVKC